MDYYVAKERKMPVRNFDVVVAGGGTAGVIAAIASARAGAKTALIEYKGYVGGIAVEGGTGLHSFYNLWAPFGVKKRQLVGGIPDEFVSVLKEYGGSAGHVDQLIYAEYDSACTNVDTEIYKFVALKMLREAGVHVFLNTLLTDAIREGDSVQGVIAECHAGAEAFMAKMFVDSTGFGDLSARAYAPLRELNDYGVTNSMGVGGVDLEKYYDFLMAHDAVSELARGTRDGKPDKIIRLTGNFRKISEEAIADFKESSFASITTTMHDNYMMFIKISHRIEAGPLNRDALNDVEYILRDKQIRAIAAMRKHIPGCEGAFIARTSPTLTIRRARLIECEYDITNREIVEGAHFEDDVLSYGFHDYAPRIQIKEGRSYGMPIRSMQVKELKNLYAIGMLITSEHDAHMSTRNTVCCMAQGQAAGTAAAMCATGGYTDVRNLPYPALRDRLEKDGVIFDKN